jgi:hypothetical protein
VLSELFRIIDPCADEFADVSGFGPLFSQCKWSLLFVGLCLHFSYGIVGTSVHPFVSLQRQFNQMQPQPYDDYSDAGLPATSCAYRGVMRM